MLCKVLTNSIGSVFLKVKLFISFSEFKRECIMEINERIFYLLEKQGRTARELGDFIGVKPSSISAWKTEGSYPSSKYIIRISEFFKVSIDYLFTGESNTNVDVELTPQEQELVNTYKQLDSRGQHAVHMAIYNELDRIKLNSSINVKIS